MVLEPEFVFADIPCLAVGTADSQSKRSLSYKQTGKQSNTYTHDMQKKHIAK